MFVWKVPSEPEEEGGECSRQLSKNGKPGVRFLTELVTPGIQETTVSICKLQSELELSCGIGLAARKDLPEAGISQCRIGNA